MGLQQISYAFQQCNFKNRLRFDKVTESLKEGTFFETQCIYNFWPQFFHEGQLQLFYGKLLARCDGQRDGRDKQNYDSKDRPRIWSRGKNRTVGTAVLLAMQG